MTTPVVLLIVIGLILIIASFFITEKLTKKEENFSADLLTVSDDYEFSDRELGIIRKKIEDVIAKQAKDILYETNESLSSMANEKTMALGDYAVAVCDEIEKNHKEVVFLYSMLDDKQKEIMKTVQAVNSAESDIKELYTQIKDQKERDAILAGEAYGRMSLINEHAGLGEPMSGIDMVRESEKIQTVSDALKYAEEKNNDSVVSFDNNDNQSKAAEKVTILESSDDETSDLKEENPISEKELNNDAEEEFDQLFSDIDEQDIDFDKVLDNEFKEQANSNEIILELYKNGDSVIDIAKQLGLGVGEVKLVIDLYQGDK